MKSNQENQSRFIRSAFFIVCVYFGHAIFLSAVADGIDCSENTNTHKLSPPEQLYELAHGGSATAQFELGLLYEYGRGVNQDDSIAACWYKKSAAQSHANASYRLAILYDNGWGLLPNKEKALKLYITAAEKGHPLAQHDLAKMYFHGTDAPKNLLQAYKWLKIAVLGGSPLMDKHLRLVAKEMSADEIEMAEYLAEEWMEHYGI